ncbi:hypothetical protein K0B96_06460 [Horticoccus luteus]|uniref:Uncharacterized protein n=1 Tax=Horticoccus luteus TaxID=2862869 RepID=A0A8F9TZ98_9BACT|nr:hypothetical protein [Horticoccus luteus]QYM80252.1 hypothetical protein K0B96_06460 [Horticoccus luteus]
MTPQGKKSPVFTNLGMHFVDAGAEIVLVHVDVNVRGLLALHARRLIKSKRALATLGKGTIRMSIASADDQERAARARAVAEEFDGLLHKVAQLQHDLAIARRNASPQ